MQSVPARPLFVDGEVPAGAIDGANVTFTLAHTPITGSVHLFDPLRLRNGVDYTISGSTITFTTAPSVGATLIADYRR
jgi:hypothetical protein